MIRDPQNNPIGILGAGQLGRMLAMAAIRLGFSVHVYAPDEDAPAFCVASRIFCGAYDDERALRSLGYGDDYSG